MISLSPEYSSTEHQGICDYSNINYVLALHDEYVNGTNELNKAEELGLLTTIELRKLFKTEKADMGLDQYLIMTKDNVKTECLYMRKCYDLDSYIKFIGTMDDTVELDTMYHITHENLEQLYKYVLSMIKLIPYFKSLKADVIYDMVVDNLMLDYWLARSTKQILTTYDKVDRFDDFSYTRLISENFDSFDRNKIARSNNTLMQKFEDSAFNVGIYSDLDWEYHHYFKTFITLHEILNTVTDFSNVTFTYERSF